jgi:hypothetical protein
MKDTARWKGRDDTRYRAAECQREKPPGRLDGDIRRTPHLPPWIMRGWQAIQTRQPQDRWRKVVRFKSRYRFIRSLLVRQYPLCQSTQSYEQQYHSVRPNRIEIGLESDILHQRIPRSGLKRPGYRLPCPPQYLILFWKHSADLPLILDNTHNHRIASRHLDQPIPSMPCPDALLSSHRLVS